MWSQVRSRLALPGVQVVLMVWVFSLVVESRIGFSQGGFTQAEVGAWLPLEGSCQGPQGAL